MNKNLNNILDKTVHTLRYKLFYLLISSLLVLSSGFNQYAQAEDRMALNFTNTDLNAVIGAVAKLTGKNFIIDPRVKGKVTVITHQSLSPEGVYQVFLSVLKVHGFAAIPSSGAIKIVPEVNAKQDSIPTKNNSTFEDGDEMVTQVIRINNVNAAQLVPILRPLVPQRGHLAAYPASNVIIISDSAANIARLNQIIKRIDISVQDQLEVIQLEHAIASDVVKTVTQLQSKDPTSKKDYSMVADDRTNSILLSGERGNRLRLRTIITHMDIPVESGGNTHVVYLRYAKAKDLVSVLTGVGKSVTTAAKGKPTIARARQSQNNLQIQADESSNALVINAPTAVFRSLRAVIRKLDIRRAQVLVEAVIAEVSYTKSKELGVQWYFDGTTGGTSASGPIGMINFKNAATLSDPPDISALGSGVSLGLASFKNGSMQIGMLLKTLAGDSTTNVLSTPTLVTLDNEEAEIIVGQNVPFVTGSFTSGNDGASNPFQTISRQDIGITLKIKPQINEGNSIKLDISQEVSSVSEDALSTTDITTNKRSIRTSVMIEDDQMLVLGGLVEDTVLEIEQKVPGLGDIPILGWLFKYKSEKKFKKNLMVFIHPKIIKDQHAMNQETGDKYNYIRSQQLAEREKGLSFMDNKELPVLDDMGLARPLPPKYIPLNSTKGSVYDAPPPELN